MQLQNQLSKIIFAMRNFPFPFASVKYSGGSILCCAHTNYCRKHLFLLLDTECYEIVVTDLEVYFYDLSIQWTSFVTFNSNRFFSARRVSEGRNKNVSFQNGESEWRLQACF